MITISNQTARRFMLAHQGLWPPRALHGKSAVRDFIRRVGCIQFDPLNIVGQNPELVLQARVADFRPQMLQELLYEDRALLDGLDKVMAIYCVEDWPYFQRYRDAARRDLGHAERPCVPILPQVRQEITERGPLSSADLDYQQPVDWPWAPTRLARAVLESMYLWGELVIHHKARTRKVYDFAARHLPPDLLTTADPNTTEEQYHDWHVHRRIGGVGLLWGAPGDAWLGIRGMKTPQRQAAIARLLEHGELVSVQIEGNESPFYLRREDEVLLQAIDGMPERAPRAAIIAPLDNLLWDRKLLKRVFNFAYCWEVYKPVEQRQYGYYVLPVLHGDRFVARFEPGRDKKSGACIIKQWWWEPDVVPSDDVCGSIAECITQFLGFLNTEKLQVEDAALHGMGNKLARALAAQ